MGDKSVESSTSKIVISKRWLYISFVVVAFLLIHYLGDVLAPFLAAALLAYLTDPLTNLLQRLHLSRTFAVVIVFFLLLLFVVILFFIFVPLFQKQIVILVSKVPQFFNWIQVTVVPWLNQNFGLHDEININDFSSKLSGHWQQAGDFAKSFLKVLTSSGLAFVGWIVNLFLVPVVLFYLLRDWPKLIRGAQNLLPRKMEPTITQLAIQCDQVLSAFLRGQLMVMIALGLLYSCGLALVGLDTALVIGMIAGLVSIVPYLGFIVGISAASIAATLQFHDLWHVAGVVLVFIVAQSIEGSILTPWFVGDKVGLHPVLVIFAVLAGGSLFGFVGVLLAIPVAAIMMVILRYLTQRYVDSELYAVNEE